VGVVHSAEGEPTCRAAYVRASLPPPSVARSGRVVRRRVAPSFGRRLASAGSVTGAGQRRGNVPHSPVPRPSTPPRAADLPRGDTAQGATGRGRRFGPQ